MVKFLTQDPTAPHKLTKNATTDCRRTRAERGSSSAQTTRIRIVPSQATGARSISGEKGPGKIKRQNGKGRILVLNTVPGGRKHFKAQHDFPAEVKGVDDAWAERFCSLRSGILSDNEPF